MLPRLRIKAHEADNKLSSLLPNHARYWLPLLEDVLQLPAFQKQARALRTAMEDGNEWKYVSTDAILKVCLKLLGQASYRAFRQERESAPLGDEYAFRRLLTVRGRSGAVLMMKPLKIRNVRVDRFCVL